ncbi:MAG: MotA/TolQ/ExbB proton channel family protein [Rikenellaceae bacterium]
MYPLQAMETAQMAVSQVKNVGLSDLIMAGGWLMIPLAALLAAAIFIFVDRFMLIRKSTGNEMKLMNRVREMMLAGDIRGAVAACRKANTPTSRMIEKGITNLGRPLTDIHSLIENTANLEVSKLEKNLPFLATIAGGAPMIGFLGTVIGMVEAFINMSQAGGSLDMSLLSSGMYTAMVTTVAGLIVGIPAYFGYNFLVQKIEKVVFQMESNTIAFMDLISRPVQ